MRRVQLNVKSEILAFRAVIFVFIAFYLMYGPAMDDGGSRGPLFLALVHLASILALLPLPARLFNRSLLQGIIFLTDIVLVSGSIYLSGAWSGDLYLIYFAVILMAGTQADARHSFLVGGVGAVLYGWLWSKTGGVETVTTSVGLRFAFFFMMAFFAAYFARQSALNKSELAENQRVMEKMERFAAIGRLARGMAHEFNNLMSVVLGSVNILSDNIDASDPMHVPLAAVRRSSQRAAHLTRKLVEFSELQAVKTVTISVNELLRELDKPLRDEIGGNVSLTMRLLARRDSVCADRGQLCETILEMATNAAEAMSDGGELQISTENVTAEEVATGLQTGGVGRWVVITVVDSGRGMSRSELDRVFEPFFSTKEVGEATGMSLAGAHGVIRKAGGHISVASSPGEGTRMRIFLPQLDA
jgi:signal transduction histidine kinase